MCFACTSGSLCGRTNTKQLYPSSNLVFQSGFGQGLQQSQCLCQQWSDSGRGDDRWDVHLKWQLIWSACSLPRHPLRDPTNLLQWQAPCSSQVSLSCSPLPHIICFTALPKRLCRHSMRNKGGFQITTSVISIACHHFCHYLPLFTSIQLQCAIAHVTCKSGMWHGLCAPRSFEGLQLNILLASSLSVGYNRVIQHLLPVLSTHPIA